MTLGLRIREERKKKGWSREKFAEIMGKSVSSVYDWEHGKSKPSTKTLLEIADKFNVSLDSLTSNQSQKRDYSTITRHLDELTDEQLEAVESVIREMVRAMMI